MELSTNFIIFSVTIKTVSMLLCLQFSSFGKDVLPEHAREDSGLEMDSPESRFVGLFYQSLSAVDCSLLYSESTGCLTPLCIGFGISLVRH